MQSERSNSIEDGDPKVFKTPAIFDERGEQRQRSEISQYTFTNLTEELLIPGANNLADIGGYIAKKVQRKCKEIVMVKQEGTVRETLLSNKQVPNRNDGVVVPKAQLVTVVEDLEIIFRKI